MKRNVDVQRLVELERLRTEARAALAILRYEQPEAIKRARVILGGISDGLTAMLKGRMRKRG